MRIFWLNGGLHCEPENKEEAQMLVALVDSSRFVTSRQAMAEHEANLQARLDAGEEPKIFSGFQPNKEFIIADTESVPGSMVREDRHG